MLFRSEVCGDGFDNDCDGSVDETCSCAPIGVVEACYTGPVGTRLVGTCRDGSRTCLRTTTGSDWTACTGSVLPGIELCGDGLDQNCSGIADEGCDCHSVRRGVPPSVMCPASTSIRALTATTLIGRATDDCEVVSYNWTVVTRPSGSGATPSSPSSATTSFTPDLVGTYQLRFTATDNEGLSSSCTTTVTSTGQGIRVELTWNVPGDVDLHLLHPSAAAWFSSPYDCYYANIAPLWDGATIADDPRLDIDDIPGDGPENINVDVPVNPQTYRVGVHHYAATGTRTATVRIYCGDLSITPVATYTRTVYGSGVIGEGDFWRVADVRWTGTTCSVTTLNTVITTATARSGR